MFFYGMSYTVYHMSMYCSMFCMCVPQLFFFNSGLESDPNLCVRVFPIITSLEKLTLTFKLCIHEMIIVRWSIDLLEEEEKTTM